MAFFNWKFNLVVIGLLGVSLVVTFLAWMSFQDHLRIRTKEIDDSRASVIFCNKHETELLAKFCSDSRTTSTKDPYLEAGRDAICQTFPFVCYILGQRSGDFANMFFKFTNDNTINTILCILVFYVAATSMGALFNRNNSIVLPFNIAAPMPMDYDYYQKAKQIKQN